MAIDISRAKPPSSWWLIVTAVTAVLAVAAWVGAFLYQERATRPIGEGDVFQSDARAIEEIIASSDSADDGVRHARNQKDLEAVSLVDGDGMIVASSSASLANTHLTNPLLQFAVESGRFSALAISIDEPLQIDGVVEWPEGSILYQVVDPLDSGGGHVLLHYDVAGLFERRTKPGEIQPETLQLLALGVIFALLAVTSYVGQRRSVRRHREMAMESELLRAHSRELEETNSKLAEARRAAELALDLAEEKMRIRSEFVLMINHELRTPLTSVVTGAELVRDGGLGEDDRLEVLESIVTHGRRLKEIIDQILAVARIENRGLNYELGDIPIDQVRSALDATDAGVAAAFADGMTVQTDLGALTLVVSSLMDNAHTHGASNVDVACAAQPLIETILEVGRRPEPAVYVTVSDDGPGIDLHFLPRVFEKFEKNSFSSGTGLGLYMVRLMVDALGGSVGVTTSSNGTTFQVALPAVVRSRVMETV